MIYPRQELYAEDVADHCDTLDEWYREAWGEHVHHGLWETGSESAELAVLKLVQRVAEAGGIGQGSRVVDIGCGYGGTSRILAKGYGASVIGYTLSKAQYEYALAQTRDEPNPEYRLQDWFKNDLPDVFYGVALSIESWSIWSINRNFLARPCAYSSRAGASSFARGWRVNIQGRRRSRICLNPFVMKGGFRAWAASRSMQRCCERPGFST